MPIDAARRAKSKIERALAPYVARLLSILLAQNLRPSINTALWKFANRNFLHHPASITATDILGNKLLCQTNDFVQRHIAVFGMWEPALTQYILAKRPCTGIFLDIGANVGYYSLLASNIFEQVIAFEASPFIFGLLAENIRINQKKNITAYQVAILDKLGIIDFFRSADGNLGQSSITQRDLSSFEGSVSSAPLQQFLSEDQWRRVKFIKIDVEGSEPFVLRSLFKSIDLLPEDVEISVELGLEQTSEAIASGRAILSSFRDLGFVARRLQGPYSLLEYLDKSATPQTLAPIEDFPAELTDCLFSRRNSQNNGT